MKRDGDKGAARIALMRSALRIVIAIIAGIAAVASIPYWGGEHFPVTSLVIYVAGMVFVAMPLCLYYESLLESQDGLHASAHGRIGGIH